MMRQNGSQGPKVTTWADYGISVDEMTWADAEGRANVRLEGLAVCPRCNQYRLLVHRERQTWHCDGCYWSGRVHGAADAGAGLVDLQDAGPMLERWRTHGIPPELGAGVPALDAIYKPRRGELTVVTGYPGDGKSSFLKWYLVQASLTHAWRFAIFSPEDMPFHLYLGQMATRITGKAFKDIDVRDLRMATTWAANRFIMLDPPSATAEGIMAQLRHKDAAGIQGVVVDPWTEIEHAIPPGMREDQYLNATLSKFRRLARHLHVHIWLVVHPRNVDRVHDGGGKKKLPVPTLDDCAGGAMFKNKTDWGLCIHRPNKGRDDDYMVDAHVQKARFSGFLGGGLGAVRMIYDRTSGCYQESTDFGAHDDQGMAMPTRWPLDVWKAELNKSSTLRGYFDRDNWTWPPKDVTSMRPVDWVGQEVGGWMHSSGRLEAYVDPGAEGWLASVRLKADATSRRTAGPFKKTDDAFAWAERLLMDWEYLPDPRDGEQP